MAESLVVASKVKSYLKAKGCHTSGELIMTLSERVQAMLDQAVERCRENKRSTVKSQDL